MRLGLVGFVTFGIKSQYIARSINCLSRRRALPFEDAANGKVLIHASTAMGFTASAGTLSQCGLMCLRSTPSQVSRVLFARSGRYSLM